MKTLKLRVDDKHYEALLERLNTLGIEVFETKTVKKARKHPPTDSDGKTSSLKS